MSSPYNNHAKVLGKGEAMRLGKGEAMRLGKAPEEKQEPEAPTWLEKAAPGDTAAPFLRGGTVDRHNHHRATSD